MGGGEESSIYEGPEGGVVMRGRGQKEEEEVKVLLAFGVLELRNASFFSRDF